MEVKVQMPYQPASHAGFDRWHEHALWPSFAFMHTGYLLTGFFCSIKFILFSKVAASQMSVDNAERIISLLSESLLMVINCSDNLIPLNLLQRICSLLDTIISQMSTPTQLGLPVSPSVIVQCKNIADLNCICHLQIKIISGNNT